MPPVIQQHFQRIIQQFERIVAIYEMSYIKLLECQNTQTNSERPLYFIYSLGIRRLVAQFFRGGTNF